MDAVPDGVDAVPRRSASTPGAGEAGPWVEVARTPEQLADAGRLLHDFNTEYGDPSPGAAALAARVAELVGAGTTDVLLGGVGDGGPGEQPAVAVVVLRYRPSLWSTADECYLAELYVAPARRGAGLGRVLLRAALDRVRDRGCDYVDLATSEDDVAARHLYETEGFRRTEGAGGPLTFHYERDLEPRTGRPAST